MKVGDLRKVLAHVQDDADVIMWDYLHAKDMLVTGLFVGFSRDARYKNGKQEWKFNVNMSPLIYSPEDDEIAESTVNNAIQIS